MTIEEVDLEGDPEDIRDIINIHKNIFLWRLKHSVKDDVFLKIFQNYKSLFRKCYRRLEEAESGGNEDYIDFVRDSEAEFIEDLIGSSFIVLQTKIRRVSSTVNELSETMYKQHKIDLESIKNPYRNIGKMVRSGNEIRFADAVWNIANYFKHRDEWKIEWWPSFAEGNDRKSSAKGNVAKTIKAVTSMGIAPLSTGNMFTAYRFFDINDCRDCLKLANGVQEWADTVYDEVKAALQKAVDSTG